MSGHERRIIKRWDLLLFVPVFDTNSNELIGYIADINTTGMLIISKTYIEFGRELYLEIRLNDLKDALIDTDIDDEHINLYAQSRWTSNSSSLYKIGLAFLELSQADKDIIHKITANVSNLVNLNI
jgi:c-di-GMP-binding flagellar brake protein YcgR